MDDGEEVNKTIVKEEKSESKNNKLPQVNSLRIWNFRISYHMYFKTDFSLHPFQDFAVKYLGMKPARGLWGIKHTRKPVDDLVGLARGLGPGAPLPYLQLTVSHRGVVLSQHKE